MHPVDITVAITAHSEALEVGPSLRSANAAISAVERAGFVVERLVGLDRPTAETRAFFSQSRLADWRVEEFEFGDPYPTRNAVVEASSGRWIAFLDADDLFSENWLLAAARLLSEAAQDNKKTIVHPELNWIFDGSAFVFRKLGQDDGLFLPQYFYISNYYDMLCAAPRDAHIEIPYVDRDLANGFGYGDMQWGIETMAAGWRHVVAPDTVIFKRRRDQSVVLENKARRTVIYDIDPMAIDRIERLGRTETIGADHEGS